ncbi:hypothetical protein NC651_019179 [Populus alba x Populus x berolinensis]|nr:hypothetical protein NC651_019179 [Populus alba x Populus x berolinensis]
MVGARISLLILQATEDILHWGPSSDDRNRAEHLREIQEMFRQFKGLKNLELSGLINLGDVEVLNILYLGENRECHIDLIACKKNIEVVKLC